MAPGTKPLSRELGVVIISFKHLFAHLHPGSVYVSGQSLEAKCGEKQFQCRSGDCIPIRFVCDGDADCKDHSDEQINECKFLGKKNGYISFKTIKHKIINHTAH